MAQVPFIIVQFNSNFCGQTTRTFISISIPIINLKANASSMGRFEVMRGTRKDNIMQLGEVVKFNDDDEMDAWTGECNRFIGTDSTIFAPFHDKHDVLFAFAPDLCRSLGAKYVAPSRYNGVPTGFYSMDFGDAKVSWNSFSHFNNIQSLIHSCFVLLSDAAE